MFSYKKNILRIRLRGSIDTVLKQKTKEKGRDS